MTISQRECFRATMAHEPHEGVLAYATYTPDLNRRLQEKYGLGPEGKPSDHLGLTRFGIVGCKPTADNWKRFAPYYEDMELPEGTLCGEWGNARVPAGFYHFTGMVSPLRNATTFEEIRDFPYPTVDEYDFSGLEEEVKALHAEGKVVVGALGHIFETAWQIRGMEHFLVEMATEPERCDLIFDKVFDTRKAMAEAMARAGCDFLKSGDDVGTQKALMFSIDQWRYYLKSRWSEVYAAARAANPNVKIWYHSDGNIMDIIPELIEIGVDILNPVQPECMDPVEIKRRHGDSLVLDGCMGTQSVMPFGTPQDVRDTVRRYVDELAKDGALMLSPTHVLEPEVPIENIEAFAETVKEYGEVKPIPEN